MEKGEIAINNLLIGVVTEWISQTEGDSGILEYCEKVAKEVDQKHCLKDEEVKYHKTYIMKMLVDALKKGVLKALGLSSRTVVAIYRLGASPRIGTPCKESEAEGLAQKESA